VAAWHERDSLRFSQGAAESRSVRVFWAHVANSYRLRGFDDEVCVAEATRAVSSYLDDMERRRQYAEGLARRRTGPRDSSPALDSKFHARAVARRLRRGSR